MTKNYIHIWRDPKTGRPISTEGEVATTYEGAVEEYRQYEGVVSYGYTVVLDNAGNTFDTLDMATELRDKELREEREAEIEYREQLSLQTYSAWSQAGVGVL